MTEIKPGSFCMKYVSTTELWAYLLFLQGQTHYPCIKGQYLSVGCKIKMQMVFLQLGTHFKEKNTDTAGALPLAFVD